ncbi:MAG TPA: hypothetical protein VEC16_02950 [Alphaproteobacteria bacterium]|nr:hypothetical protein [Alphaproteobacteria bacterium]
MSGGREMFSSEKYLSHDHIPEDPSVHKININIKTVGQLFNSFDPSPFLEKDLDDDAFEYIVSSVQEHPLKKKQKMILHFPKNQQKKVSEVEVRRAIHHFFEYKKILAERNIKLKLKEGELSFFVGSGFLIACLLAGEYILTFGENTLTYILFEGLLIGGWVAMWKPISDVLYEWWPIYQEKRVYNKIANMDIDFKYT